MSEDRPQFPDYGDNGDTAGVRRTRRSFRLVVVSVVGLTIILWFSERLLRHDAAERAYIASLTARPETAVVLLHEAVDADRKWRDQATPKYVQALALASAKDVSREYFEGGIELDPQNEMFRIRYGLALLADDEPELAAIQFAAATTDSSQNSLPIYLEAVAIAKAGAGSRAALTEALVRIAAANSRQAPISFPRPMWSINYPQDRATHSERSREIVRQICVELESFANTIVIDVRRQIDNQQLQRARTWLSEIMEMGERLVKNIEPEGTLQCQTGLRIQQQVLETLANSTAAISIYPSDEIIERKLRVTQALEAVAKVELGRDTQVSEQLQKSVITLQMAMIGIAAMIFAHVLGLTLYRILGYKKSRWTVPHSPIGKVILGGGTIGLLLLLIVATAIQRAESVPLDATVIVSVTWYTVVAGLILFGLLYPAVTLKSIESVSRKSSRLEDMELTRRLARRTYRRAYASLSLRYYGILSGTSTCIICIWIVGFRIVTNLFPWQFSLLASGFNETERAAVEQVVRFLI